MADRMQNFSITTRLLEALHRKLPDMPFALSAGASAGQLGWDCSGVYTCPEHIQGRRISIGDGIMSQVQVIFLEVWFLKPSPLPSAGAHSP